MNKFIFSRSKNTCWVCIVLIILPIAIVLLINHAKFSYSPYVFPHFSTKYSPEEHIERLDILTKEKFSSELLSGEIVDYKIDIMYSFTDNNPRYFIIEIEYKDEYTSTYNDPTDTTKCIEYSTKYAYTIGLINDSVYNVCGFVESQSPYTKTENFDKKKYYSDTIMAVYDEDELIQICNFKDCDMNHISDKNQGSRLWIEMILEICPVCYGCSIPEEEFENIKYYFEPSFTVDYSTNFRKPKQNMQA